LPGGIVVQVARDAESVDLRAFRKASASLTYLGHDGRCEHAFGPVAVAYFRLSIPGERQRNVECRAGDGYFVFLLGRLDHPEDLSSLPEAGRGVHRDIDLVRAAYQHYGPRVADYIRGSAAFVIVDTKAHRIVAGRDALGKEPLYFSESARVLLLASEPQALARHPEVADGLDTTWLASHFSAMHVSAGRKTAFRNVEALLPGETLVWDPDRVQRFRCRPELGAARILYRRDQEYAEHFRTLLTRSVRRSLGHAHPIGIMLSGGMDSCPVATLAAEAVAEDGEALKAYSWSLPSFPTSDETRQIAECAGPLGIPVDLFSADRLAFFESADTWPVDINTPMSNAFLRLFLEIYERAARDGVRVLLQGTFGDRLYPDYSLWFLDALRDRRFELARKELAWLTGRVGFSGLIKTPAMRQLVKRLIRYPGRAPATPDWLTPEAASLVEVLRKVSPRPSHPRSSQYASLLGDDMVSRTIGHGVFQHRLGVVRVDPYHDWDLIDFMLSVPTYQCFRQGQTKYLARLAMRGRMPESLRLRPRGSLLDAFFVEGFRRVRSAMREVLTDDGCSWQEYLKKEVVNRALMGAPDTQCQLVAWWAFSYELWRRALAREGLVP
jgi:asparagine synthase (glutamine-hydrolysing)